jgi:hypothetical protein
LEEAARNEPKKMENMIRVRTSAPYRRYEMRLLTASLGVGHAHDPDHGGRVHQRREQGLVAFLEVGKRVVVRTKCARRIKIEVILSDIIARNYLCSFDEHTQRTLWAEHSNEIVNGNRPE